MLFFYLVHILDERLDKLIEIEFSFVDFVHLFHLYAFEPFVFCFDFGLDLVYFIWFNILP